MAEDVLNNTTNAKFIPTIIAQEALGRLKSYLHVARNISRDSDWSTASFGQVLRIPKRGAVSANDKSTGVVYTKQNPTATDVSVTLNKHKEVTFAIDDVTKVLENQNTLMGYGEDGAIALAESIESDLLALHPSITNTKSFDATSATTIDTSMLAIRKFFTDQKVPKVEQKYLVVDASVYNNLLATDKYSRYDARGDGSAITTANLLKAYGFEISESQLIPTSGSPVAYHNIAFSRNGLILASRPLPRPEGFGGRYAVVVDPDVGLALRTLFWYNADLGAHQLTLDVLYGVAILDDRRVLEVEST
jgi:hypothetical protein